jgi:hypothetical protein
MERFDVIDVGKMSRPPELVIDEARNAATALQAIVSQKPKKVVMNGEQHLEFEDWQTVGNFYGLAAKVKNTMFVDYGGVQGWEATAAVIRMSDGMEISQADAMCLNDEEKWSTRSKYEYQYVLSDGTKTSDEPPKNMIVWVDNPSKPGRKMPKREKIKVGDEKVPMFQLRSMAQTRACAKAFRNVLAWVVVLAGYRGTPAEEVDGMAGAKTEDQKNPPEEQRKMPEQAPDVPPAGEKKGPKDPAAPISEPQVKAIHAILNKIGVQGDKERHDKVASILKLDGLSSINALTKGQASTVIDALSAEANKK